MISSALVAFEPGAVAYLNIGKEYSNIACNMVFFLLTSFKVELRTSNGLKKLCFYAARVALFYQFTGLY